MSGLPAQYCSDVQDGSYGWFYYMFDDDLSSYWHNNWSIEENSASTVASHWFTIDLGKARELKGFDYWGRQSGGTNGQFKKGKIYVSNSPFDVSNFNANNHAAAKAYYDNAENVAAAEFTFDYSSNASAVRTCRFANTVTGRYVMVLLDQTTGNFASGAEFKLVAPGNGNFVDIDRSGWTVTGCSTAGSAEGAGNGEFSSMLDGNLSTYYHQSWQTDGGANHWFVIDMQKVSDVNGFKYWRRQGNQNGQFLAGKVYVSENPFATVTDHESAIAYMNDAANVPAGSFEFKYEGTTASSDGMRYCEFDQKARGRYVMVVLTNSGQTSNGYHSCCAEFKLFREAGVDLQGEWDAAIVPHMNKLPNWAPWYGMLGLSAPSSAMPADLTATNFAEKVAAKGAEVDNFIVSIKNQMAHKRFFIQHALRRGNAYLTAVVNGNSVTFNTRATASADAMWEMCSSANGFLLYNPATGYYLNASQGATTAYNGDPGAQVFVPEVYNGNVLFVKYGSSDGLNVDTGNLNLTQWGKTDAGSQWKVRLVSEADAPNLFADPVASTTDAPKYYRVLNARWMYERKATSLSTTPTDDGRMQRKYISDSNTYWRVETSGTGVKMLNVSGKYLDRNAYDFAAPSANGMTVYLKKMTPSNYEGWSAYGISKDETLSNGSYLDATNYDNSAKFCWQPGAGNGDNGSLWYFIPVSDSESAALETSLRANMGKMLVKEDADLVALFGQDIYGAAGTYKGGDSYAELRAAITEGSVLQSSESDATLISNVASRFAELNGKYQLRTCAAYETGYMSVANNALTPSSDATDLNSVWSFETAEGGYKLRSHMNGGLLGYVESTNTAIPLTESGDVYTVHYNPTVKGFAFRRADNNASDAEYAIHHSTTAIVRWSSYNIPGSHWKVMKLSEAGGIEVSLAKDSYQLVLNENTVVNTHASAADLAITISKVSEGGATRGASSEDVITIKGSDFNGGKSVSFTNIGVGNYVVNVPAGMFLVDGKPSAAISHTFEAAVATGVEGLDADVVAPVIYDLYGRRLSAPVKGVNVINGRKVIVK